MCCAVPSDPPADRRDEHCSSAAACGRKSEGSFSAAVKNCKDQCKPEVFSGHRKVEVVPDCGQPGTERGCHPEEAKPTKDLASDGSKRSRLLRQNRPGAVGILRLRSG